MKNFWQVLKNNSSNCNSSRYSSAQIQLLLTIHRDLTAIFCRSIIQSNCRLYECVFAAVFYGDGVYFAQRFSYSAQYIYSRPDQQGFKHIFQSLVLIGHYTVGRQGLREPPVRDTNNDLLFDSVTDNVDNPTMFVVFKDNQAYPEYLIRFKTNIDT